MLYLAKWDGGRVYLSRDEQMEQFLEKGANIYKEEEGTETLIATPEEGFLVERPTFPVRYRSTSLAGNGNTIVN